MKNLIVITTIVLLLLDSTIIRVQSNQIFNEDQQCDIATIEAANQAQLNSILSEIVKTNFFKFFKVNLDEQCPFKEESAEPSCSYKPAGFGENFMAEEQEAEPACSVQQQIGDQFRTITDYVDRTAPDTSILNGSMDCKSPYFWLDICSKIPVDKAQYINLQLNPERYTGYKGNHIWEAIYKEQCFTQEHDDKCYEEEVLYKLMSGIHSSTTIGIAENYYPPNAKRKTWGSNHKHFMKMFKGNEQWLTNLHFSFSFMLKAVYKAKGVLKSHKFNSGNVEEDEKAQLLMNRFLESHMLQVCEPAFMSFDESKMFKNENNSEIKQQFKKAFLNISDMLNCVSCQKCKLHAKLSLLGIGTALKLLMTPENHIKGSISREEIVALVNTLHKFSSSIQMSKKLTSLYEEEVQAKKISQQQKEEQEKKEQQQEQPQQQQEKQDYQVQGEEKFSNSDLNVAVELVASLGGKVSQEKQNQLIDLIFLHDQRVIILAKNYKNQPDLFLSLVERVLKLQPVFPSQQKKEKDDYDAIVIGTGLSGMAAALNLLDRGGSVFLIEKENHMGGNSALASSGMNAINTESGEDSYQLFLKDTLKSKNPNLKIVDDIEKEDDVTYILTRDSRDALEWVRKRLNVHLDQVAQLGGHTTARTHRPSQGMVGSEIIFALQKELKKYENSGRYKVVLNAKVEQLLKDEKSGKILGIQYQYENKSHKQFAENTVLATGGFANDRQNDSFINKYRPDLVGIPTTNGEWATGDGVRMGIDLGADLIDMDKIQLHPTGFIDPKNPEGSTKPLCGEIMRGVGGILLNSKGQRFCNELGTRAQVTADMQRGGEKSYALILNERGAELARKHTNLYHFRGLLTKLEGIEELSQHLKVYVSDLQNTFKKYNQDAEKGQDEFGKKAFKNAPVEDNETFYVGYVMPVLHYTMGGLRINTQSQILKKDGNVIQGLYGVGEVTGGVHGNNRLGGNSLLECALFGVRVSNKLPIKTQQLQEQQEQKEQQQVEKQQEQEQLKEINLTQLEKSNGLNGEPLWIAIDGQVYDFTEFDHPGGEQSIKNCAGKDCTSIFKDVHNLDMLEDFDPVGVLVQEKEEKKQTKQEETVKEVKQMLKITKGELEKNNGLDGAKKWTVIKNKVYDLTNFDHPGGEKPMNYCAGKDCTEKFFDKHEEFYLNDLAEFMIGELV